MADTCATPDNDVLFGAKAPPDGPIFYGSRVQVRCELPAANDADMSQVRCVEARRSGWGRRPWRHVPQAATPRGWGR